MSDRNRNTELNPYFVIRSATEKDARAISALIRRNADVVLSAHYSLDQLAAWKRYNTPVSVRRRMANRMTFCGYLGGRLCATIALQGCELVGLYVSPDSRDKGMGKTLLAYLESFAATQDIAVLHLTSTPSAIEFYKQNGWRAKQTVVLNILGVDFEETYMSKRFDQRQRGHKSQSLRATPGPSPG